MGFKDFMKRILPVTYHKLDMATDVLLREEQKQNDLLEKVLSSQEDMMKKISNDNQVLKNKLANIEKRSVELDKKVVTTQKENYELLRILKRVHTICEEANKEIWKIKLIDKESKLSNSRLESIDEKINGIRSNIKGIGTIVDDSISKSKENVVTYQRQAAESVWAFVWHDTIVDSEWLKDKRFSPGRWAVGYQYLYALYRVLNEYRPERILELGLGQSTKMIGQYVDYNKNSQHIVVEHDADWENFYTNNNEISDRTTVMHFDLQYELFMDSTEVAVYEDFEKKMSGLKFDFISIDAPFGSGHQQYARIDTLKIIPQCLAERFVIMVDDYNRAGEQAMVEIMKKTLNDNGINYCCGKYSGAKDTFIITSEDYKFLCSM